MPSYFFSIVIPTRQRHDTLKYSIQSVLNQNYANFELVIMDNFSSSETAEVVRSFNDSRINYNRASERLSMCDNWELGLSYATGDYVFILGDDDALMPDGLEVCSKLIDESQVDIVSWFRYQYWWDSAIVPWGRNKLSVNLAQVAEIWDSRKKLKQFYNSEAMFEHLPMIYNSFIKRDLIQKIKSINGRYFNTFCPDVESGIINAYFSDFYLYSLRAISIAGLSGHSTGTSSGFSSLGIKSLNDFVNDQKKDVMTERHPNLIPSINPEIGVADVQLQVKDLFFPDDREIELNIKNLLRLTAGRINRDPDSYENTLADIKSLADKHKIPLAELDIPVKLTRPLEPFQGTVINDGVATNLVINCKQVGISNVAQAAMLAQGILPKLQSLIVYQTEKQERAIQCKQLTPKVLVDGVFFQLYKTGIARVWKSLIEEWGKTGFADHIVILDRANTAPQIPGAWYRTIPAYDYNNTAGDREMLQEICDEEGAELFISTYYTTPTTTPSVFMAYDMIPEEMKWDLTHPMWREKHYAIQHASSYVSISENTARDLVRFFPDISPESIAVAHCGVASNFTPANSTEINSFKTKYGISKPYFLIAGTGGYKNVGLFFQAFARLATKPGFEIVLTGASSLTDEWRNLTSGSVVHTLQLSDEELRLAYAGAVALVYPSQYEGFGLPVLEALACGCPVITCPNASLPEVAGEAALYVKDNDIDGLAHAICDVQKPSIRQSLIAKGLEQAKKFSWAKMASEVSAALIDATLLPLKLSEINFIVFPDWNADEESLGMELTQIIGAIAFQPDKSRITLLIDRTNISEDDANMFLSSIAMNLMMAEELDVSEGPEISLVGQLSEIQWQALLPKIQGRIPLENEDLDAIASAKAENITICDPTDLDEVITNNSSSSQDDYRSQVELKGYQFTQDWFSWNIPVWQQYLQPFVGQPHLNVLEIGSWEGRSTCWLLEHVLTHESAKITCVDTFAGSFEHTNVFQFDSNYLQSIQERFDFNVGQTGMSDKVQKIVGMSNEVVRSLPFNAYDFAYIDGSHIASDVLQDTILVWPLVKVGGYIIFDDYNFKYPEKPFWNTQLAVDTFIQIFQDKLNVIHVGHQVIVEKLEA